MGHADFASQMDMFLFKDNTNILTSTLRAQNLSDYILPKWTRISIIKPINIISNKKQKSNPMAPPKKIEYIRRRKMYNGHYY